MFVRVGGPLTHWIKILYDTSPESCANGFVIMLLRKYIALNYCEYKVKSKTAYFAQVSTFERKIECFYGGKISYIF